MTRVSLCIRTFLCIDYLWIATQPASRCAIARTCERVPRFYPIPNIFNINPTKFDVILKWPRFLLIWPGTQTLTVISTVIFQWKLPLRSANHKSELIKPSTHETISVLKAGHCRSNTISLRSHTNTITQWFIQFEPGYVSTVIRMDTENNELRSTVQPCSYTYNIVVCFAFGYRSCVRITFVWQS